MDVPIYTLQGKELKVPIGLQYTSNGIKLDEIAGVAGLGWRLSAGGCITRTVMDMPDEFTSFSMTHSMPSGTLLTDLISDTNNTSTYSYLRRFVRIRWIPDWTDTTTACVGSMVPSLSQTAKSYNSREMEC